MHSGVSGSSEFFLFSDAPPKCLDRDCVWEDAVQGLGMAISNINPQKEARFSLWKKIVFPRERRKWSLGVGQHLKGA